jgi:hypothetical protein
VCPFRLPALAFTENGSDWRFTRFCHTLAEYTHSTCGTAGVRVTVVATRMIHSGRGGVYILQTKFDAKSQTQLCFTPPTTKQKTTTTSEEKCTNPGEEKCTTPNEEKGTNPSEEECTTTLYKVPIWCIGVRRLMNLLRAYLPEGGFDVRV